MSILSDVLNGKLPSVIDAVKGWNSKNPGEKLSDRSIEEMKKGAQEGRNVEELIKIGDLATNPREIIEKGEIYEPHSIEWNIIRDYYADIAKQIRAENKGINNLGGNVFYTDVLVNGENYSIKGTSKPKNIEEFVELKGDPNTKTDPERFFETKFVDGDGNVYEEYKPNVNWNRAVDTEARMLEQICRELGSYRNENGEIVWENTDVNGTINLYTENEPCPSCLDVIKQFSSVYKNIKINIYWTK